MAEIKVAFWNVENLFDTTASSIATDLEFTPAQGWTQAVFDLKVRNIAAIIWAVLSLAHLGKGHFFHHSRKP
jgi:hypothetical protein